MTTTTTAGAITGFIREADRIQTEAADIRNRLDTLADVMRTVENPRLDTVASLTDLMMANAACVARTAEITSHLLSLVLNALNAREVQ